MRAECPRYTNREDAWLFHDDEESKYRNDHNLAMTYEEIEDIQQSFCKDQNNQYVAASPNSKVGFALETRGLLPINGLRHPPQGDTTGLVSVVWGRVPIS